MVGRDPHEEHRVATPLELLFDLTFATCFSFAASQFATEIAAGRYAAASIGFGFASFAICWAWINFAWFASAYDTDDWVYRLMTMLQMVPRCVTFNVGTPSPKNSKTQPMPPRTPRRRSNSSTTSLPCTHGLNLPRSSTPTIRGAGILKG